MQDEAIQPPGSTVKQFSVMLQNRVGALSALLGLLDMHGIFCLGFSMHDCHEATIARLVVSDPERTSEIFLEKGICYTDSDVLVAALRHGPADLKRCLDVLYSAEMNVNFVYPLLPRVAGVSLIALHVDDMNFGRTVLNFLRHQSAFPAGSQPLETHGRGRFFRHDGRAFQPSGSRG